MKKPIQAALTAFLMGIAVPAVMLPATAVAHQTAKQQSVGNVISALNNINAQINKLNALNNLTVEDVRVVDVDNVLNNANIQALNNALNRNRTNVQILQNFLNNSVNNNNVEIIKDALNNNDVAITDVVAINVLSGGDVVVFRR